MFNFGRQGRTNRRQRGYEPSSSRFGRAYTQGQLHPAGAVALYHLRPRPLSRPFNEIWTEAEKYVSDRLAGGVHPENLEREIENDMRGSPMRPDRAQCLRAASRIIRNLRRAGRFDELPSYVQYMTLRDDVGQREEFGRLMRERFSDVETLRRDAIDEEIAAEVRVGGGVAAGIEMLVGRTGRPGRSGMSGALRDEDSGEEMRLLQEQVAEARQRVATAEARLGMAQQGTPAMAQPYATERVNLVHRSRGSLHRPRMPELSPLAAENRFLGSRGVNGQFGTLPHGHENLGTRSGQFSRRFLVEIEGTRPSRPSISGRQTWAHSTFNPSMPGPSPEARIPTPPRETSGNSDANAASNVQSEEREPGDEDVEG